MICRPWSQRQGARSVKFRETPMKTLTPIEDSVTVRAAPQARKRGLHVDGGSTGNSFAVCHANVPLLNGRTIPILGSRPLELLLGAPVSGTQLTCFLNQSESAWKGFLIPRGPQRSREMTS